MEQQTIWLVGGDERQALLAGLLAEDGHKVQTYAMERRLPCAPALDGIGQTDCVILPLPAADGKGLLTAPLAQRQVPAGEVLARLTPGQRVLAGKATPWLKGAAEACGLVLTDYFDREELALLNAIPTAEGAIRIAMEALPVTLHGARVLILGFGRLGLALGPRLHSLGARVTVYARRGEQQAQARLLGLDSVGTEGLAQALRACELVVNTVPAPVLGAAELALLPEGAVVLDLASLPGGVDDRAAEERQLQVIHALGLPGKEAPLTAARFLRDTVYHILESLV